MPSRPSTSPRVSLRQSPVNAILWFYQISSIRYCFHYYYYIDIVSYTDMD